MIFISAKNCAGRQFEAIKKSEAKPSVYFYSFISSINYVFSSLQKKEELQENF